jgi:hypothetical protein
MRGRGRHYFMAQKIEVAYEAPQQLIMNIFPGAGKTWV